MKIHEYQAKTLFKEYGITVPLGFIASTPEEAGKAALKIGSPVVVKAQVHAGGRGKGGGIRIVSSSEEAMEFAAFLFSRPLVTPQTGPSGVKVGKVLVEEAVEIKKELYLGITIDRSLRLPILIASSRGGMDIEEIARDSPEDFIKGILEPDRPAPSFLIRKLCYGLNLQPSLHTLAEKIIAGLLQLFIQKDCSLAEINPLVVSGDGGLIALDAKLDFDDSALYRQGDILSLSDRDQENNLEKLASHLGIKNYVKLEGNIGCMVNGAGLAMAVLDMINYVGGRAANFLDIGTFNDSERVVNACKVFQADDSVTSVLVNVFGGLARADVIAAGLVEARKAQVIKKPLVVRLAGTNVEEGKKILEESGFTFIMADNMQEVAIKARDLAQ